MVFRLAIFKWLLISGLIVNSGASEASLICRAIVEIVNQGRFGVTQVKLGRQLSPEEKTRLRHIWSSPYSRRRMERSVAAQHKNFVKSSWNDSPTYVEKVALLDELLRFPDISIQQALQLARIRPDQLVRSNLRIPTSAILTALVGDASPYRMNAVALASRLPTRRNQERVLKELGSFGPEQIRYLLGDYFQEASQPTSDKAVLRKRMDRDEGIGLAVAKTSDWMDRETVRQLYQDLLKTIEQSEEDRIVERRVASTLKVPETGPREPYETSNPKIINRFISELKKRLPNDHRVDIKKFEDFLTKVVDQHERIVTHNDDKTVKRIILALEIDTYLTTSRYHVDFGTTSNVLSWAINPKENVKITTNVASPIFHKVVLQPNDGDTLVITSNDRRYGQAGPHPFAMVPVPHAPDIPAPGNPRLVLAIFYGTRSDVQ